MIDRTFRQWRDYCADHPWLSAAERIVLLWLVHDHSAAEGLSRPGLSRLGTVTRLDHKTITRALTVMAVRGDVVLAKRWPKNVRKADEYAIPWLRNPVIRPRLEREISRSPEREFVREISRRNSRTSSPKKEKGTTARFRGAAVVQKNAGDAPDNRDGDTQPPCRSCGSTEPASCFDCGKAAPDAIRRILLETTGRNIDPDAITGRKKKPGTSDR